MTASPLESLCPVCGGANQCAVAQGLPPGQCWCMNAHIAPAALAAIAPQHQGRRCICAACARPPAPQGKPDPLPADRG